MPKNINIKETIESLNKTLSHFQIDKYGSFLAGTLVDLELRVRTSKDIRSGNKLAITSSLRCILHSIGNISALIERLDFMLRSSKEDEYLCSRWHYFAGLDICHFHTIFRSIMDYVTSIFSHCAKKPGQIPTSFYKLLESKAKYQNKIPEPFIKLLTKMDWFRETRGIRDELIHSDAKAIIFAGPSEGIIFQILSKNSWLINKPFLMYNQHVVYFDRYFAYYFSNLLNFLEELAIATADILPINRTLGEIRYYSSGFSVLRKWIYDLEMALNELHE